MIILKQDLTHQNLDFTNKEDKITKQNEKVCQYKTFIKKTNMEIYKLELKSESLRDHVKHSLDKVTTANGQLNAMQTKLNTIKNMSKTLQIPQVTLSMVVSSTKNSTDKKEFNKKDAKKEQNNDSDNDMEESIQNNYDDEINDKKSSQS